MSIDLPLTQLELIRSAYYIKKISKMETRWVRGLTIDTEPQKDKFKELCDLFGLADRKNLKEELAEVRRIGMGLVP